MLIGDTWAGTLTVMLALPLIAPDEALTEKGPPAVEPAVNRPLLERVPPPVVAQVKLGDVIDWPNWSAEVAENCCVPLVRIDEDGGVTEMEVSVWLTVTLTGLVADRPPVSWIVTRRL